MVALTNHGKPGGKYFFFPPVFSFLGWLSLSGRGSRKVSSAVFALANNCSAKQSSRAACGTGDKIPDTAAAAPLAVIQKSENERGEAAVQCKGDLTQSSKPHIVQKAAVCLRSKRCSLAHLTASYLRKEPIQPHCSKLLGKLPASCFSQQLWERKRFPLPSKFSI